MIINSDLTIFHKVFDEVSRIEKWEKHYYEKVWFYGRVGANANKGYENANNADVRISYKENNVDISKISIGDIFVKGNVQEEISTQSDLTDKYNFYNITSINDNNFGNNPHVHIGGN